MSESSLKFKVSTGLKNVLGSRLITDDEVAIFELVKNSFDAGATRVDIFFGEDKFVIADNGEGMSKDDIEGKWLFVAYSKKRDEKYLEDYRSQIKSRKQVAGSKGIGRFSSDSLGEKVVLQSKPENDVKSPINQLEIDWSRFDSDQSEEFTNVDFDYKTVDEFTVPKGFQSLKSGTVISITELKSDWDRDKLIKLKTSLTKLINPISSKSDNFKIFLHVPSEKLNDKKAKEKAEDHKIINGEVKNFIFDVLQQKTTFIAVKITDDGKFIESELVDRGECVYKIREPNPYNELMECQFDCQLFFLNTSAKTTFTRRIGTRPVRFGSVFLFRNGFRIFPIGNIGDDWFGIDLRHQQRYSSYLGTRNIIGKVDITDEANNFEEASSRNAGLIENKAVAELKEVFTEHCLKRLEKYVVPVLFPDKENNTAEDIKRLLNDPAKARIAKSLATLLKSTEVELLYYSEKLINIISERSEAFEGSIADLSLIAEKIKDKQLYKKITTAQKEFLKLKKQGEETQQQLHTEKQKRIEAEEVARESQEAAEEAENRVKFFIATSSIDKDTLKNLHHQVRLNSMRVKEEISNFIEDNNDKDMIECVEVFDLLEKISFRNNQTEKIAKFASKTGFREKIQNGSLANYIEEYIEDILKGILLKGWPDIKVKRDEKDVLKTFRPIDVSILIDNFWFNAKKAGAKNVLFEINHSDKGIIEIIVSDDGRGLSKLARKTPSKIFEEGFTTTDGAGLGLFHVKHILNSMNGDIKIISDPEASGLAFKIRLAK